MHEDEWAKVVRLEARIRGLEEENRGLLECCGNRMDAINELDKRLSSLREKVENIFDKTKEDWSKEGRKINAIDFELLRQEVLNLLSEGGGVPNGEGQGKETLGMVASRATLQDPHATGTPKPTGRKESKETI